MPESGQNWIITVAASFWPLFSEGNDSKWFSATFTYFPRNAAAGRFDMHSGFFWWFSVLFFFRTFLLHHISQKFSKYQVLLLTLQVQVDRGASRSGWGLTGRPPTLGEWQKTHGIRDEDSWPYIGTTWGLHGDYMGITVFTSMAYSYSPKIKCDTNGRFYHMDISGGDQPEQGGYMMVMCD